MNKEDRNCTNCKHNKISKDEEYKIYECEYGFNTYLACQCASTDDLFEK